MQHSINAIIVDDEAPARTTLRRMLDMYCPEVNIQGEAEDIVTSAKLIKKLAPDLVFLDIRIGHHLGFDLLELVDNHNFELVFVTAYDEYAVQAFEWNALSYLLKPIIPTQLQTVVSRCLERYEQHQLLARYSHLKDWQNTKKPETLTVANEQGYHFLNLQDLIYLQSDQGVTTFHLANGERVASARNIGQYARMLPKDQFYRSHQSYLINLDWVSKYLFQDGGIIMLRSGQSVPLSQSRREGFIDLLKK